MRRIIAHWPAIDDRLDDSDEFLAINNCLNEICHGVKISEAEWRKWFTEPKDEINKKLPQMAGAKRVLFGGACAELTTVANT